MKTVTKVILLMFILGDSFLDFSDFNPSRLRVLCLHISDGQRIRGYYQGLQEVRGNVMWEAASLFTISKRWYQI